MKIFLYFTLIVFSSQSCSVNGRICDSSDSFIKLYTKQETDQNCLPEFNFSMDWWAQLGVNQFYVFVNRKEFLPDKFSCLDSLIEVNGTFGAYIQNAFDALSNDESNLKTQFCSLGKKYLPDFHASHENECEMCKYAINIVENAPEIILQQMDKQIVNDLKGEGFCGDNSIFETKPDWTECDNFVNEIVPKVTKWFQDFIKHLGSSRACQNLSFCNSD